MAPKVGVVLSGCGFLDGSEIHEAVLLLLALDERGASLVCMAPRGAQASVVDHATGERASGAPRDMFAEAARIARGRIEDLSKVKAADLDALILPGGFGAVKNLSDFATKGALAQPHAQVARLLRDVHAANKPIGALCIAPAVIAATLGRSASPTMTIGDDRSTAETLTKMGVVHRECAVTDCVVDEENRIVSTPAYMYDARVSEVREGVAKLVDAVLTMVGRTAVEGGAR
jgi:enhancing lycopene biosynthesis protein 2